MRSSINGIKENCPLKACFHYLVENSKVDGFVTTSV